MLALLGWRGFSVSATRASDAVSCNEEGVFVADVPLLERYAQSGLWSARPIGTINDELTIRYDLPIDITSKAAALGLIAAAFNRGDLVTAAIATVQMRIPKPQSLLKGFETDDEIARRAAELWRSGLLKADWDPAKHPRTGTKPNPGQFALKPKPTSVPSVKPRTGWPQPHVNRAARKAVAEAFETFAKTGRFLFLASPVVDGIIAFFDAYSPTELNQGEDRLTAQLKSALQGPKTFEQLQQEPTENSLGYEQHHIVNQNDDNLLKGDIAKFGPEQINDPSNVVWVPRLLHECISAEYSSNSAGSGTPLVRDVINKMDFRQQREWGLKILRKCGVLK